VKRLISTIGDRLQAIFPPNRIMLVLAGPITAGSLWLSAWLTANVPGVALPAGVVAGAMGVVGLIVVTLIYKWFDQWQKGEPLTIDADLDQALADAEAVTTAFFSAHGTVQGVGAALQDLHDRIAKGSINEAEIASGISGILDAIDQFVDEAPDVEVAPEPVPVPTPPAPVEQAPAVPPGPAGE
jgi:hypothetical protein